MLKNIFYHIYMVLWILIDTYTEAVNYNLSTIIFTSNYIQPIQQRYNNILSVTFMENATRQFIISFYYSIVLI